MGKIGILTYHKTTNIGATLQAYALQRKITDMGAEVEIIDYRCDNLVKRELPHRPAFEDGIKRFLTTIISNVYRKKKLESLNLFVKNYYKTSDRTYDKNNILELNSNYTSFIVGSDIVWELYVNGEDYSYFLDFAEPSKRFSYAASFGYSEVPEQFRDNVKNKLNQFKAISVRETRGQTIVNELTNKSAELVADPTLLLTSKEWDIVASDRLIKDDYIVLYFLDKKGKILDNARKLSKQFGYKIILIADTMSKYNGVEVYKYCSISDYLSLIKYASLVITASYHGMLFSINYNRNFYYFNRAHSDRMDTIVDMLELGDRNLNIDEYSNIDMSERYDDINIKIKEYRESSINYLNRIVNEDI